LSLLEIRYPKAHEWPPWDDRFRDIARQIHEASLLEQLASQDLASVVPLPRLLLLMNLWGRLYLPAKYGFEAEHLASAQEIFKQEEATLAVRHADECYRAASALRYHDRERLAALQRRP